MGRCKGNFIRAWGIVGGGNSPHRKGKVILLDNYKLEPLTDFERKFATENHNLVYDFLHRHGYSLENNVIKLIANYLKWLDPFLRSNYFLCFLKKGVDKSPGMCGRSRY